MLRTLSVLAKQERTLNKAYLKRVATSVTIDEIRRRRVRPQVYLEDLGGEAVAVGRQPDQEELASGRQIGEHIRACVALLSDDRRRAVTLYLQGDGVPAIAEAMGWDRKRAENLVYRGLADLRSHLRACGCGR